MVDTEGQTDRQTDRLIKGARRRAMGEGRESGMGGEKGEGLLPSPFPLSAFVGTFFHPSHTKASFSALEHLK